MIKPTPPRFFPPDAFMAPSSSSSSRSDPLLIDNSSSPAYNAFLYACIICDDMVRSEAASAELPPSLTASLRSAALRCEGSTQSGISFVARDEVVRRRASLVGPSRWSSSSTLPTAVRVHVLRRHGHAFAVITLQALEETFASRFCEEACAQYARAVMEAASRRGSHPSSDGASASAAVSQWSWRRRRRESAVDAEAARAPDFADSLRSLLAAHGNPQRLARLRRVRDIDAEANEVANVMSDAVDHALATQANLDDLEDKSEWLLAQATAFKRSTRRVRCIYMRRNFKCALCLGAFALLMTAMGVLVVLNYTCLLRLWPGTDCPPPPPSPPPPPPHQPSPTLP